MRPRLRDLLAIAVLALAPPAAATAPDLFGGGRLVYYVPRGWDPATGTAPGPASLRADADDLRRRLFRAIVTPATVRALTPVCRVFKRRGFRTVLVALPDPRDAGALRTAEKQRRCADGYVVGDGGVAVRRYARADLETAVARLRRATHRPVAVREALASYDDPSLLALGDWVFPVANTWTAGERIPQSACGWSIQRYLDLGRRAPAGVPVVLAETAFATAGDPAAGDNDQRAYFACIETRAVRFEYFEAFDQPWRDPTGGAAAHWGLFRADGTPKKTVAVMAPPSLTLRRRGAWLRGRVANVAAERYRVVVDAHGDRWQPRVEAPLGRTGKWKARIGDAVEVRALLVPRTAPAPPASERPPQVDGETVIAAASG